MQSELHALQCIREDHSYLLQTVSHMHASKCPVSNFRRRWLPFVSMAVPWKETADPLVYSQTQTREQNARTTVSSLHSCVSDSDCQCLGTLKNSTNMFPKSHAILAPAIRQTGRLKRDHIPQKTCIYKITRCI